MMDAQTGRILPLVPHIRQSIANILGTRIGTRVEREEYGSLLPELLDMPLNEATLLRCNAAVIMAVAKWEPRYTITDAHTQATEQGVVIRISGSLNGHTQQFIVNL